jgi:hypothetical protein
MAAWRVESFGAKADDSSRRKVGIGIAGLGEHAFVLRKQILLDAQSVVPIAVEGRRYAGFMTGARNQWLTENGFEDRYGSARARALHVPPNETRAPIVVVPGLGEPRGLLATSANLLFPVGLLVVAARFLIRAAVILSDPNAASEPSAG